MSRTHTDTAEQTYVAVYTRDEDGFWLAEIESEPQAHTYGRTLKQAQQRIREALGVWLEVGKEQADRLRIEDRVQDLSPDLQAEVARLAVEREDLQRRQADLQDRLKAAARALTAREKLSYRDASVVLKLAHQRIEQLVK